MELPSSLMRSMHRFENKVDSTDSNYLSYRLSPHDQELGWVHKSRVTPIESLSVGPKALPTLLLNLSLLRSRRLQELRSLSIVLENDTIKHPESSPTHSITPV